LSVFDRDALVQRVVGSLLEEGREGGACLHVRILQVCHELSKKSWKIVALGEPLFNNLQAGYKLSWSQLK